MSPLSLATFIEANDKRRLLVYFRERAREALADLQRDMGSRDFKELASGVNKAINASARQVTESLERSATTNSWSADQKLSAILTATYASQIAMLELRNEVWPYEYMAFSRRIGELWEDFIRKVFDHAPATLQYFVPPLFSEVRSSLRKEISEYIASLTLSKRQKQELLVYYEKVWTLVDSGEINLQLDLHCLIREAQVNVDLKSGFGSNEKGNTNRLLMVATIYKNLEAGYRCVLLVRSREDQNNHYFRILKNSGVWEAYCGKEAYTRIQEFTSFDVAKWIATNVDWLKDFSRPMSSYLRNNKLDKYLAW